MNSFENAMTLRLERHNNLLSDIALAAVSLRVLEISGYPAFMVEVAENVLDEAIAAAEAEGVI